MCLDQGLLFSLKSWASSCFGGTSGVMTGKIGKQSEDKSFCFPLGETSFQRFSEAIRSLRNTTTLTSRLVSLVYVVRMFVCLSSKFSFQVSSPLGQLLLHRV